MGAAPKYSIETAREVLRRLSEGETLREIGRADGMPAPSTVIGWANGESPPMEDFSERYARARAIGWELMAEELLEISDDGANDWMERNDPENPGWQANGEHLQRSRLRTDNRKWLLSKRLPDAFGEKSTVNVSVNDGLAARLLEARKRRETMIDGSAEEVSE